MPGFSQQRRPRIHSGCAASAATFFSSENFSLTIACPRAPYSRACSMFVRSPAIASASAAGSFGGTSSPVTPVVTISGTPAIGVETTGKPAAIASMITVGRLSMSPLGSLRQGRTKSVPAARRTAISLCVRGPTSWTTSCSPRPCDLRPQRLLLRTLPDDFAAEISATRFQNSTGIDQIGEALLLDQPSNGENQRSGVG